MEPWSPFSPGTLAPLRSLRIPRRSRPVQHGGRSPGLGAEQNPIRPGLGGEDNDRSVERSTGHPGAMPKKGEVVRHSRHSLNR